MFTVMLFAGAGLLGASLAADPELAADVKSALKRAGLSNDFVSRVTGISIPRLSDMLNAKIPFTGLCRLLSVKEMKETDFRVQFLDIQADRVNRLLISADFRELLTKVDALGVMLARAEGLNQWLASVEAGLKPMAKMPEPQPESFYTREVTLPLGQKERAS